MSIWKCISMSQHELENIVSQWHFLKYYLTYVQVFIEYVNIFVCMYFWQLKKKYLVP